MNNYSVHFFVVNSFTFEVIKSISQGVSAFFIKNPCVLLIDKIVVKFDKIVNSWMISEFRFGGTSKLKEIGSKPNLFYMGLMAALSDNLFHSIPFFTFLMLSKPN